MKFLRAIDIYSGTSQILTLGTDGRLTVGSSQTFRIRNSAATDVMAVSSGGVDFPSGSVSATADIRSTAGFQNHTSVPTYIYNVSSKPTVVGASSTSETTGIVELAAATKLRTGNNLTIAGGIISIAGGTVTSSTPTLDISQTWNSSGVTFTGIKLNVTNTASQAASLLLDLQVGASSQFNVTRAGVVTIYGNVVIADGSSVTSSATTTGLKFGGASDKLGFFNATPVAKLGSTTDIKDGLVSLGFLTDSGATPLNLDGGALTAATAVLTSATGTLTFSGATAAVVQTSTGGVGITISTTTGGPSGGIALNTGTGSGGNSGAITLTTGTAAANTSGNITLNVGSGSSVGSVNIQSNGTNRIQTNGTGIGFFNATPVAKQGSTTDLKDVLVNLGFLTDGGATPLNLDGGTLTAGPLSMSSLSLTHGTITTDVNTIAATVTWNQGGTTFTAWELNVTNTASAAGSMLIDLQVGGSSQFNVTRAGIVTMYGNVIIADGSSITSSATTTGLKFGGASDKLGFFNATPVAKLGSTTDIKDVLVNLGFLTDSGATPLNLDGGALTTTGTTSLGATTVDSLTTDTGGITVLDGQAIVSSATTTGIRIGGASDKLGFFNATPVAKQGSTVDLRTALINLGFYTTGGASPLDLNGGALTAASGSFGNGLVGTPSITFASDPDTGLYRVGTNQLGLAAGGALTASVSSTQFDIPSGKDAVIRSFTHATGVGSAGAAADQWTFSGGTGATDNGSNGIAGLGSQFVVTTGTGGAGVGGGADGGNGGAFVITTGDGGASTGGGTTGGNGGSIEIQPGSGGTGASGGSNGSPGSVTINPSQTAGVQFVVHADCTIGDTGDLIGFLGATPVVRPTSTTDLRTALINLGLYTTGGASPLNLNGGALTTTGTASLGATTVDSLTTDTGGITVLDGQAIVSSATTTGIRIGGASDKLGFFNATPVAKQGSTVDLRAALINLGFYTTGGASPLDLNGGALTAATAVLSAAAGTLTFSGATSATISTSGGGVGITVSTASSGPSGAIALTTGTGSGGNSGAITLTTGNAAANNSGNITLNTGSAGGTVGSVQIQSNGTNRIQTNGTGIGFFNATPVAKQGSTTDIKDALVNLGFLTDSGATPLNLDGGALTTTGTTSLGATTVDSLTTDTGGITILDGQAIVSSATTTGIKIGGASDKLGFFNATPVAKQGSTTDLRTALINLGFYTTGGASPLNLNGGDLTSLRIFETNGDDSSGVNNKYQIRFSYNGTASDYPHFIRSRHNTSATNNAIDFYTCDGTQAGTFPTNAVLGLSINNGNVGVGTTTITGKLNFPSSTAASGGIYFHTDTNLYRSAADTLRTDDAFVATGSITGGSFVSTGTASFGATTVDSLVTDTGGITILDGQSIVSSATTTGIKIGGASDKLGFFNATPVAKQGSTTDIKDVLVNLGFLTDSGATPLNLDGGALTATGTASFGATTVDSLTTDTGGITILDGQAIVSSATTTGIRIGGASDKLGFFNATPVVKQTSTTDLRAALINLGFYTTGGASPLDLNGGILTSPDVASAASLLLRSASTGTVTLRPGTSTAGWIVLSDNNYSSAGTIYGVRALTGTISKTSGAFIGVEIRPTYNETSGTASNVDLLINRTETAIGSGDQANFEIRRSNVSKFLIYSADTLTTIKTTTGTTATVTSALTVAAGAGGDGEAMLMDPQNGGDGALLTLSAGNGGLGVNGGAGGAGGSVYINAGIPGSGDGAGSAGEVLVNSAGEALNFRVRSDADSNCLVVDGTNNKVGIGTASPSTKLHVVGDGLLAQVVATTGSPTALTITGAAHTTLTASTEATDININLDRTVQFATGALTTQRALRLQGPTYGFAGSSTLTTAVTMDIESAPVAGTNATITNKYALRVNAGTATGVPIVAKGAGSQSGNLTEWQNSSGTVLTSIDSAGQIVLANGEFIRNSTDGRMDFMPSGTSASHFGLRVIMTSVGGVQLTTVRASDGTLDTAFIRFDAQPTVNNDVAFAYGASSHSRLMHTVTGNDTFQVGVTPGASNSGAFCLIHTSHFAVANRSPTTLHTDPTFYVYSADSGQAADYIRLYHDQTDGKIDVGNGLLRLAATGEVFTQSVSTTGSPNLLVLTGAAHTTLTASTEATDVNINLARTVQFATGALTTQRAVRVQAPTYGFVGSSTLTTAVTMDIESAPVAGTNATITNKYALRVNSGYATAVGLVVRGASSQSANVVEIQNNSSVVMDWIDDDGSFYIWTTNSTTSTPKKLGMFGLSTGEAARWIFGDDFNCVQCGNSKKMQIVGYNGIELHGAAYAGGSFSPTPFVNGFDGIGVKIPNYLNDHVGLAIFASAAPTVDLFQCRNNGGTILFAVSQNADVTMTPAARATGSPTLLTLTGPAHTALTASAEATDVNINLARTVQFSTGALTTQRAVRIQGPTYGFVGSSTLTTAVTVDIESAPVAGTNATITNKYALRVNAGTATGVALVVKAAGSQTGDLSQWQDSSATILARVTSGGAFISAVFGLTDAATIATDASKGNHFTVTLGGNRTLGAPTNPTNGQRCTWEIIQPGSGGPYTLSLDTGTGGFAYGTDITGITLTTTASKADFITAIYNSTANKWRVVGFVRGY